MKESDVRYRVWAVNVDAQPGLVQLVNNDRRVLYERLSSAVNFGSTLDLHRLPDGDYTFVVQIGRDVHRFALLLSSTSPRSSGVGPDQLQSARPEADGPVTLAEKPAH